MKMIVGPGPGLRSRLWDHILEVAPQACNFIKKRVQDGFSCEYCEVFKNTHFKEHLEQLLLNKKC